MYGIGRRVVLGVCSIWRMLKSSIGVCVRYWTVMRYLTVCSISRCVRYWTVCGIGRCAVLDVVQYWTVCAILDGVRYWTVLSCYAILSAIDT